MALAGGATLAPFGEFMARRDGGDGMRGDGFELAGGVRYANPASGWDVEARGRMLALYSADGYRERGVSVTARLTPEADGRGSSLSLSPRWGAEAGDAKAMWRGEAFGTAAGSAGGAPSLSLNARLGYGVGAPRLGGVATPFGELDLTDGASRRLRVGTRFGLTAGGTGALELELGAERREVGDGNRPDHRIDLAARLRF